jgi:hypothetical protein
VSWKARTRWNEEAKLAQVCFCLKEYNGLFPYGGL